ncbi:MAG: aspartate-semialdehyde dehydrogenase [Bacteroidetes bacterium]|nr:MAG: aspartate-semialdehyde dehydrogenase [Bacteroidota bacterium]
MKVAVVGATGLVGQEMIRVLEEFRFPVIEFLPVASEKSVGKKINFNGKEYAVISVQDAVRQKPDMALFSAGSKTSLEFAPLFAKQGTYVIDNSSAFRMDADKPLIIPEINAHVLKKSDKIIANPNCSTIQMLMVLYPLHQRFKIKKIIVSTYQAVTGTGAKALQQLMEERQGKKPENPAYPYPIDLNLIPQIDVFLENDFTKEEMKMHNETRKILNDNSIQVNATCVRVPVIGGHSESVYVEFEKDFEVQEVRDILNHTRGVVIQDDVKNNVYPMPLFAHKKNETFVGRIRKDFGNPKALNLFIVADNLRKGAATNAVQIAEYVAKNFLERVNI